MQSPVVILVLPFFVTLASLHPDGPMPSGISRLTAWKKEEINIHPHWRITPITGFMLIKIGLASSISVTKYHNPPRNGNLGLTRLPMPKNETATTATKTMMCFGNLAPAPPV